MHQYRPPRGDLPFFLHRRSPLAHFLHNTLGLNARKCQSLFPDFFKSALLKTVFLATMDCIPTECGFAIRKVQWKAPECRFCILQFSLFKNVIAPIPLPIRRRLGPVENWVRSPIRLCENITFLGLLPVAGFPEWTPRSFLLCARVARGFEERWMCLNRVCPLFFREWVYSVEAYQYVFEWFWRIAFIPFVLESLFYFPKRFSRSYSFRE